MDDSSSFTMKSKSINLNVVTPKTHLSLKQLKKNNIFYLRSPTQQTYQRILKYLNLDDWIGLNDLILFFRISLIYLPLSIFYPFFSFHSFTQ